MPNLNLALWKINVEICPTGGKQILKSFHSSRFGRDNVYQYKKKIIKNNVPAASGSATLY